MVSDNASPTSGLAPLAASSASVGITFDDPVLEASVKACLERVEGALRDAVAAADPVLAETAKHLVEAGGKRFRPLLTSLTAHFCEAGSD